MTAEELRALARERREQALAEETQTATPQTADELRRLAEERRAAENNQPGLFQHLADQVVIPAQRLGQAIVGQQDPREADTEIFSGRDVPNATLFYAGKALTFNDRSYADVVRNMLGNRFLEMEEDANGYPIVTYIDDEGNQRREYINRPGLDMMDVERAAIGSAPFMLGGGLMGMGLKSLGGNLLLRMAGQGAAGGLTSIASDAGSSMFLGNEQGINLAQAGEAALGGAVGEALSGPVAFAWNRIFTREGIDPVTGRLTGAAYDEAKRVGLDPDSMNERLSRVFAQGFRRGADTDELGVSIRTNEFGIPSTLGQRSKDSRQLVAEEQMRRGLLGGTARDIMTEFGERQKGAVEASVDNIGLGFQPQRDVRPSPRELGESVQSKLVQGRDALFGQESARWDEIGTMFPEQGAFGSLPGILRSKFDEMEIPIPDAEMTPQAHRMMTMLQDYARGEVRRTEYEILPADTSIADIDAFRRRLLRRYQSAQPNTPGPDIATSKAIYDAFNDWIDDAASRSLLSGSVDDAAKLRSVRGFGREIRQLLTPRDRAGRLTPGGRILSRIVDRADSGEGVVRGLFGDSPAKTLPDGGVDALRHMRDVLVRTGNQQAWDDIRLAYWLRLTSGSNGKPLPPGRMRTNIESALQNNETALNLLFNGEELSIIRRYSKALEDIIYKDPNPSGTAYVAEQIRQDARRTPFARSLLDSMSARYRFGGRSILMANILRGFARRMPNVVGLKEGAGQGVAEAATEQMVRPPPLRMRGVAPAGATIGAQGEE